MDGMQWRRWTAVTSAGELAGFCVPATVGAATAFGGYPDGVVYAAMLAAGFVEGAVLGLAQALVLRRQLSGLPVRRYALATGAAAAFAYALGMLPSTLGDRLSDLPVPVLVGVGAAAAVLLLGSIGTGQWLVLRRAGADRPSWIAVTAGAWAAGLAVFMLTATPLWRPGQPVWLIVVIGIVCGAAMAFTVAALTGLAAIRLGRPAPPEALRRAGRVFTGS